MILKILLPKKVCPKNCGVFAQTTARLKNMILTLIFEKKVCPKNCGGLLKLLPD
jgi:hypothetical protein